MIKLFSKLFFSVFVFLFLFFPPEVFAVTVDVTNIPNTISSSSFSINVFVYGANTGKNYLRVDLFKEGTFNYFGETFNGNEWYFGSIGTSYFPIDIISSTSTASAIVQAQIGEPSTTDYPGPGAYKLRIRRYTSASSYSASGSYDVTIDIPTPTPTPTSTPTSTSQNAPSPTPTKSSTPTPKPLTPVPSISPDNGNLEEGVLGESTESAAVTPSAGSTDSNKEVKTLGSSQNNIFRILTVIGIVIFVFSCAILLFQHFKNKKINSG